MTRIRRCFVALKWFINARYGAVLGVVMALVGASWLLDWRPEIGPTAGVLSVLLAANAVFHVSWLWAQRRFDGLDPAFILKLSRAQMVVDLTSLTLLVHLFGGAENPFSGLFLIHVIIACFFEVRRKSLFVLITANALYLSILWGEYFGLVVHRPIPGIFETPIYNNLFWVLGISVAFSFGSTVLWYLVSMLAEQVRRREEKLEELATELAGANLELKRNQELKEGFFRTVAHEMKRPITATIQLLEAVKGVYGPQMDPKALDFVSRAQGRAESSFALVKDLMQFARLENPEAARGPTTPGTFGGLATLLEEYRPVAQRKELRLEVRLGASEARLGIDETDLQLVASNLISNAIRYSRAGGKVEVETGSVEGRYFLRVADQGIGISKEDQKRLFQEFFRSTDAKRHSGDGSGLGLAIVKRLVDRNGGKIEVKSEKGEGTEFRVEVKGEGQG